MLIFSITMANAKLPNLVQKYIMLRIKKHNANNHSQKLQYHPFYRISWNFPHWIGLLTSGLIFFANKKVDDFFVYCLNFISVHITSFPRRNFNQIRRVAFDIQRLILFYSCANKHRYLFYIPLLSFEVAKYSFVGKKLFFQQFSVFFRK